MSIALAMISLAVAAPSAAAPPITKSCLLNREIRNQDLSAENGYFARTAQGWWRNTGAACSAYARDRSLATRSMQASQCRGDVVTVFAPVSRFQYGGCILGDWEKVAGPPEQSESGAQSSMVAPVAGGS